MFKLQLPELLIVDIRLPELLKKLSEVVLRVVKLSFLTGMVDNVGETNGDTSGLNSMRFSPEDFLEVIGIFRVLYVQEGFFFKISKYFCMREVAVSFSLVDPSGHLISLISL